jgi:hypothetical protein
VRQWSIQSTRDAAEEYKVTDEMVMIQWNIQEPGTQGCSKVSSYLNTWDDTMEKLLTRAQATML